MHTTIYLVKRREHEFWAILMTIPSRYPRINRSKTQTHHTINFKTSRTSEGYMLDRTRSSLTSIAPLRTPVRYITDAIQKGPKEGFLVCCLRF